MHPSSGKTQTLSDRLDPARAAALHVALGCDGPVPQTGDPLPPFFHQAYFWQAYPESALGRDGHPRTGGFIPDTGLPRRMWAGGDLVFHAPLIAGKAAVKTTTISRIVPKQGRTGRLVFVTLTHDIRQQQRLCITEEQHLVYREDPAPDQPTPKAPVADTDETHSEKRMFSAVTLFRYSALTLNGHRIHYDIDYCRSVEGYPGLVVHGPLLAQHLMLMADRGGGRLARFSFRATAPLFHFETATLCQKDNRFWVRGPDGRLCMQATAEFDS